jgi:putative RNA 2'-phosphotransferase
MDMTALSKQMSRVLRHRPDSAGLRLDKHGWCNVEDLLRGLETLGMPTTREQLEQVVQDNDKKRFVLEGDRIRAAQGHTIDGVKPVLRQKKPPSQLFHGTTADKMSSIEREGLVPMRRHHVHLSLDENTAGLVGSRRGPPVVLAIDAAKMQLDGYRFFVSDNGVWLTERVPPKYFVRLP